MDTKHTAEQLNSLEKDQLVKMYMELQDKFNSLDEKLQIIMEQLIISKNHRFGSSSEKLDADNQISFMEVDGEIIFFNEAEAVEQEASEEESGEDGKTGSRKPPKKTKGRKEAKTANIPQVDVPHAMSEEELIREFGENGWYELPEEVITRYRFTPAKIELEVHRVKVYKSKKDGHFKKADHPSGLFRGSLASPTLLAAILNAKYVNGVPLYRQEKEFLRYGVEITRREMAHWCILSSERYLSILYDYMHDILLEQGVIQADETPTRVIKEDRTDGKVQYMWAFRSGKYNKEHPIVLFDYQPTRNASCPDAFLKDFKGICVTDGYQVYHTLEGRRDGLRIAGCWAHSRRRFDEAVKALDKNVRKDSIAYKALRMIQAIYREEGKLQDMTPAERKEARQLTVRPLVDAYFVWAKEKINKVPKKSSTWEGFNYSLNQEKYLRVFLEDGEIPIDNNAAESTIRNFCIGKKNWVMIDTVAGAEASAVIYSIIETAKLNDLKPYDYLVYLLEEIPKHMDDTDLSFCEKLLPWSPDLPENCRKNKDK